MQQPRQANRWQCPRLSGAVCCATMAFLLCCSVMPVWAGAEDVLGRLDLARPELAAVKAALAAGDTTAATAALLQHFRTRKAPKWYTETPAAPKPNPAATDPAAERILRREYSFVGKKATLTQDLNWNANPLRDSEWPIELNRHYTWRQLVAAYNRTGNPAYAEDFVAQLRDWCADNPRPATSRKGGYTWRTLECGIRLTSPWPHCFFGMLNSPTFTPDVLCLMLEGMWQQADYLTKFRGGGNWLVTETSGLMTCAVLFPEFVDSPRWQKESFARLAREIDNQVPPDGAQVELTPHYHGVTMGSFLGATRIAEYNGIAAPENVKAGILRMGRYLLDVSKPNLHAPMFNDSDDGSVARRLASFATAENPAMQYVLSRGKEGTAPAYTSIALPYAGQYVMRSGWDEQALYLAMDAGPYGAGHQHEDKLQIEVHAFGRSHILDPGRFTYAGGPWRSYFLATRSHSTVLVNGRGQNRRRTPRNRWIGRRPQDNLWLTGDAFDFMTGIYNEGYGKGTEGVTHIRKVFFKRNEYWLVHDLLVGPADIVGEYTASVQYQFGTTGITAAADGTVIASHNKDANLAILPVSDRPFQVKLHEGEEKPPKGWIAWSLHKALKTPATMAVIHQKSALPIRIDTLLLPYAGADCPKITVRRLPEDNSGRSALEITGPGWRDVYHCAHAPGAEPQLDWVRHDDQGREQARASHGPTGAGKLPVQALRQRLTASVPGPGRVLLDYGLAEGGGYLFHQEQEAAKAGECALPLPSLGMGQPYVYCAQFLPATGAPLHAEGTFVPKAPPVHDFQAGDPGDWSTGTVVTEKDNKYLHAELKAGTKPVYLSIVHPLNRMKGDMAFFSLRYRVPLADGGDWCYTKLSLTDTEGRRWSSYLARKPSAIWQRAKLQRKDLRRDDGKKGNAVMPPDAILKAVSVTLRKGGTKAPVTAVLEIDDISWTDGR